jgi:formiminotetrahydrofolate cyclodeaminase
VKKFKNFTLTEYSSVLSQKVPAPGGGSASALTGALGASLISMVVNYSLGKSSSQFLEKKFKKTLQQSERIRKRLLELVDLDAQAYLALVKAKKKSPQERQKALKNARAVPMEICRQSYEAIALAPFLVENGNKYLLSDVEVAVEMLWAAFKGAMKNVEANQ